MTQRPSRRAPAPSPKPSVASQLDPQAEAAADLLKAMSNPQRLRVLCLLLEGERSVGQINEQIRLSQSALSQHLGMLRDRKLVTTRREAQTVFYSVAAGPVHDIIQTLHAIYCAQPNVARLCDQEDTGQP
jgi:DNA-binding transcriptional ArsR family regulator